MLHANSDKRHDGGERGRGGEGLDKVEQMQAILLVEENEWVKENVHVRGRLSRLKQREKVFRC